MTGSITTICRLLAAVLLAGAGEATLAQATTATTATPTAPAPPDTPVVPLVREGSRLLSVTGRLLQDERTGWWTFHARTGEAAPRVVEFVMLPNRQLEQMQRILRSEPDDEIAFEVSGDVFVYRTRNFLLPTGSAQVIPTEATPAPAPGTGEPDDDSVEAIMRQLAEAVGPLQRRHDATAAPEPAAATAGPREGTEVVWRRGRLRRTDQGAWVFVFDSDAEGTSDPPLIVMPCLLLERMEQYVARAGYTAPLLLSGRIYRYGERSYLLPSVFRIPRERTALVP